MQGHVDGAGEILDFSRRGQDHRLEIALPPEIHRYCIDKGSLAIDGISLTIAELTPTSEAVVDVVMDQLKEIFRRGVPPQPVMATYRRLDKDSKYGYPSYCWKVGVVASELEGPKPIPDRNLYFCHDAWSDYQGWVEGSLRSTKNVVERVLEKSN